MSHDALAVVVHSNNARNGKGGSSNEGVPLPPAALGRPASSPEFSEHQDAMVTAEAGLSPAEQLREKERRKRKAALKALTAAVNKRTSNLGVGKSRFEFVIVSLRGGV